MVPWETPARGYCLGGVGYSLQPRRVSRALFLPSSSCTCKTAAACVPTAQHCPRLSSQPGTTRSETQSHDPISCYWKPVEGTNEIAPPFDSVGPFPWRPLATDRIVGLSLKSVESVFVSLCACVCNRVRVCVCVCVCVYVRART